MESKSNQSRHRTISASTQKSATSASASATATTPQAPSRPRSFSTVSSKSHSRPTTADAQIIRDPSTSTTVPKHSYHSRHPRPRSQSQSSGSRSLTFNERQVIKERDGSCLFCGFSSGTEVAHIVPKTSDTDHEVEWIRQFMMQKDFSKQQGQNLMLLCANHHRLFDAGCYAIVPSERNLALMIAFEEHDFARRCDLLTMVAQVPDPDVSASELEREVPALEDLEPVVEIIWIHGELERLQFGDHYLRVSANPGPISKGYHSLLPSASVPQSISWKPAPPISSSNAPFAANRDTLFKPLIPPRKLLFYDSQYGYQALIDLSLHQQRSQLELESTSSESGVDKSSSVSGYEHRVSPYALLARSLAVLSRATYPVNERARYVSEMVYHLRRLYNRVPAPGLAHSRDVTELRSHNPWEWASSQHSIRTDFLSIPADALSRPSWLFLSLTWANHLNHPCRMRGPALIPPPSLSTAAKSSTPIAPHEVGHATVKDSKSRAASVERSRPNGVFAQAFRDATGTDLETLHRRPRSRNAHVFSAEVGRSAHGPPSIVATKPSRERTTSVPRARSISISNGHSQSHSTSNARPRSASRSRPVIPFPSSSRVHHSSPDVADDAGDDHLPPAGLDTIISISSSDQQEAVTVVNLLDPANQEEEGDSSNDPIDMLSPSVRTGNPRLKQTVPAIVSSKPFAHSGMELSSTSPNTSGISRASAGTAETGTTASSRDPIDFLSPQAERSTTTRLQVPSAGPKPRTARLQPQATPTHAIKTSRSPSTGPTITRDSAQPASGSRGRSGPDHQPRQRNKTISSSSTTSGGLDKPPQASSQSRSSSRAANNAKTASVASGSNRSARAPSESSSRAHIRTRSESVNPPRPVRGVEKTVKSTEQTK